MDGGVSPDSSPPNLQDNSAFANDFPPLIESQKGLTSKETTFDGSSTDRTKVWKSLFIKEKEDPSVSKIPYFKPQIGEGKKLIISPTDFVEEIRVCEKSLVGFFVGRRFAFPDVEAAVKKVWNLKGNFRLTMNNDSIFYFDFELEEDRAIALEHGSMFLSSRLFMIKPWHLFVEESILEMKSIPIWLNLRKIPLHLWNPKGIGMIASVLGTPLLADKHTLARTRMNFARVCVEVEVDFDYPESIPISFGGKDFIVPVEYSWKPSRCISCATFGHSSSQCPKVKKIWVPKKNKGNSEGMEKIPATVVGLEDGSLKVSGKNVETNEQFNLAHIELVPRVEVVPIVENQERMDTHSMVEKVAVDIQNTMKNLIPETNEATVVEDVENGNGDARIEATSLADNVIFEFGVKPKENADKNKNLAYSRKFKRAQAKGVVSEKAPTCCMNSFSLLEEEPSNSSANNPSIGSDDASKELNDGNDYVNDIDDTKSFGSSRVKVKSLAEIPRRIPLSMEQEIERIVKAGALLGVKQEGKTQEEKKVHREIMDRQAKERTAAKVKDVSTSQELGRGKRTSVKKKLGV